MANINVVKIMNAIVMQVYILKKKINVLVIVVLMIFIFTNIMENVFINVQKKQNLKIIFVNLIMKCALLN